MLFVFRPENAEDKLEVRIYDTEQDRCFYTAEDMLVVNMEDIACRLDDFVGLTKEEKKHLRIQIDMTDHAERDITLVKELLDKFLEVE
jgi:hypothetical protein